MHDTLFIVSVEHFSYFAIFFFALFSGTLIPIPEEIILFITGYMIRSDLISTIPAVFVIISAFIVGDNIVYKLTLNHNKHVAKFVHEVLSLKIISARKDFIEKHIGATIFICRFIPFLRFVGPVFSGYTKVKQQTFMIYNTLATFIYAPFLIWIGYFFNDNYVQIVAGIGKIKHIIFIIVLVIIGIFISRAIDSYFNKKDLVKS
jgi:membrane protein DedA with SNARE-associated domain